MAGVKSGSQIVLDYNNACRQAAKLEQAAASVRKESRRFQGCRSNVAAAWKGENAERFTGKMGMVTEDLEKIAKSLDKAAEVIRTNARLIYEAEMEAKRIAETRTYM